MSRFFELLALAALLCLSSVSAQSLCGGAGFNLDSLVGQEFFGTSGNFMYAVAPCGVVRNATACPNPNYPNAAFCQTSINGGNGTSLAQYTAANSTWGMTVNGDGVVQEIQDGTPCGAYGNREASFVYLCDSSATTPRLINVTEVHTCYYTAYIATTAACSRNSNTGTGPYSPVGTRYYDTRCGGGMYDLSSLSSQDLFFTPNISTTSTVWFLRVCGAVSNANCTATQSQAPSDPSIPSETAMLCQSDQNNPTGNDHAASFYVPNKMVWTVLSSSGGIRLEIQDGTPCGNFNRESTINFVCDPAATTAVLTSVIEPSVCYYTATVRTNLVCPNKSILGSSGGVVPVQSSTGGSSNPPGNNGNGNGAASTTASAALVAVVVAAAALML